MSLDERRGYLQSVFQDEHQSRAAFIRQDLVEAQGRIAAAEKDLAQLSKCVMTAQTRREADEMADGIMNMRDEADTLEVELKDHEGEFFESYVSYLSGREFDLRHELCDSSDPELNTELNAELEAVIAEWREFSTDDGAEPDDDNLQNALCRDVGADV